MEFIIDEKIVFETLFDNELVGIIALDQDRIIRMANFEIARMFGYETPSQMEGMNIFDFHVSEENYIRYANFYSEDLAIGKQVKVVDKFKHKSGSLVWVNICGMTIDRTVSPDLSKGTIWIIEDISMQKKAENELRFAHSELDTIFENALVGILVLRGGRHIRRINQAFASMLGYDSTEELKEMPVTLLHLSLDNYNEFGNKHYMRLIHHDVFEVEYQLRKKNGEPLWVALSGRALDLKEPANLDLGVIWVVRDISKRKEAERKIIELERRRTVSAMTVTANHEINQPLMILQGSIELLKIKLKDQALIKYLDKCEDSVQRISSILSKFERTSCFETNDYVDEVEMLNFDD
jgi:PAS domain S-box-containing protein